MVVGTQLLVSDNVRKLISVVAGHGGEINFPENVISNCAAKMDSGVIVNISINKRIKHSLL